MSDCGCACHGDLKLDAADMYHVNVQVTRQFAMLHAKDGIRINSVNPGYVLTDVYGKSYYIRYISQS